MILGSDINRLMKSIYANGGGETGSGGGNPNEGNRAAALGIGNAGQIGSGEKPGESHPDYADDFSGAPAHGYKNAAIMGNAVGQGLAHGSMTQDEAFRKISDQGYSTPETAVANFAALNKSMPTEVKAGMSLMPGVPTGTLFAGMALSAGISALTGKTPFVPNAEDDFLGSPDDSGGNDNAKGILSGASITPNSNIPSVNIPTVSQEGFQAPKISNDVNSILRSKKYV